MSEENTTRPEPEYQLFVGIDIALESFMVCISTSVKASQRPFNLPQTPGGFEKLKQTLLTKQIPASQILIVLEATNTYWMQLALYLYQAGFSVSLLNPLQALHFAKAQLKKAKTDQIDARILAELAAALRPAPWSPPPAEYEELLQRLAQRDTFVADRQQERNRLAALLHRPKVIEGVQKRFLELISWYDQQIEQLDEELEQLLNQEGQWQAAATRLSSIKGVGPITTGWLLVATLAFENCATPEQAAAFAGLVPMAYQSGKSVKGKASISGSCNQRLRKALYMAAMSASRWNPQIKAFYERLIAKGKPKKVAICACAHKLLKMAWALVKHERLYDPTYGLETLV